MTIRLRCKLCGTKFDTKDPCRIICTRCVTYHINSKLPASLFDEMKKLKK